jgi:hypothetical protein
MEFAQFEHAEGRAQILVAQDREHRISAADPLHKGRDAIAEAQNVLVSQDAMP